MSNSGEDGDFVFGVDLDTTGLDTGLGETASTVDRMAASFAAMQEEMGRLEQSGKSVQRAFRFDVEPIQHMVAELRAAAGAASELTRSMERASASAQKTRLDGIAHRNRAQSIGVDTEIRDRPSDNPIAASRRDERILLKSLEALTTSIAAMPEQLAATLAHAVLRSERNLITSTPEALAAGLERTRFNQAQTEAKFGNSEQINALSIEAEVRRLKLLERIGEHASAQEVLAAQATEAARLVALKEAKEQARISGALDAIALTAEKRALNAVKAEEREKILQRPANVFKNLQANDPAYQELQLLRANQHQATQEQRAYGEVRTPGLELPPKPPSSTWGDRFGGHVERSMDYALIGGAMLGMHEAIKTLGEFDSEMVQFQTISRASNTEMTTFRDSLLKMSETSRFSVKDISDLSIELAQSGLSTGEISKALQSTSAIAAATGSSLKATGDTVALIMDAFAFDSNQYEHIANTVTTALNTTRATMTELNQGLSSSSNIAKEAGLGFDELTAAIGTLAQAGIKNGAALGTRSLIQQLTTPTQKLLDLMQPLGISLDDISLRTNGFVGVLEKMREKGFSSADALQAFGMRGASVFSALSSNLPTMREQIDLYSTSTAVVQGATDANASLYASFQRLGNTVFEVLDKSFRPLIAILRGVVNAVTEVVRVLTFLGPLLPPLITGFTAMGIAMGIAKLTTGIAAATTALTSFAAAGAFASASVVGIGTSMAAVFGPIALAIGVAAGVATAAYMIFASGTEDRLDRIKQKIDTLKDQAHEIELSSVHVDQAIADLDNRRDRLNADSGERKVAIRKLQAEFKDLDGSINENETSIDKLIGALQRLRGEMAKELPEVLGKQLKQMEEQYKLQAKAADEKNAPVRSLFGTDELYVIHPNDKQTGRKDARAFIDAPVSQQVDTDFHAAGAPILTKLREAKRALAEDDGTRAILDDIIGLVQERMKAIQDLKNKQTAVNSLRGKATQAEIQEKPAFQTLLGDRDTLENTFDAEFKKIESRTDVGPSERLAQLKDLKAHMKGSVKPLQEKLEAFKAEELGNKVPAKDLEEALSGLSHSLTEIKEGVTRQMAGLSKAAAREEGASRSRENSADNREISLLTERSKNTRSVAELDANTEQVKALLTRMAEREASVLTDLAEKTSDNKLTEQQQHDVDEIKRKRDDSIAKFADDMNRQRKRIIGDALQFQIDNKKVEYGEVQAQITALKQELNRSSTTPERMEEIKAAIDTFLQRQRDLIGSTADLEMKKQGLVDRPGQSLPSKQIEAGSVQDQIYQTLSTLGRTDLLQYALATGKHESGFDPNSPAYPGHSAAGLNQFIPSTWSSTGPSGDNISSVEKQTQHLVELVMQIEKALGAADPQTLYLAHQQGIGGAKALLAADSTALASSIVPAGNLTANNFDPNVTVGALLAEFRKRFQKDLDAVSGYVISPQAQIEATKTEKITKEQIRTEAESDSVQEIINQAEARRQTVHDATAARIDDQTIAAKTEALKNIVSAAEAEKLMLEIIGAEKGKLDRKIETSRTPEGRSGRNDEQQTQFETDARQTAAADLDKRLQPLTASIAAKDMEAIKRDITVLKSVIAQQQEKGQPSADNERALAVAQRRLELAEPLRAVEKEILEINRAISAIKTAGLGTEAELPALLARRNSAEQERLRLMKEQQAIAKTQGGTSFGQAFQKGTQDYLKNSGMLNAQGQFKSLTEQMSGYWNQALQGMDGAMNQLFVNLFSGTMKAKDAFRQFGVSVLQTFLKIASDAAVKEIMKLLLGGGDSGGGFLGSIVSAFTGAVTGGGVGGIGHMATGGSVARRMADGGAIVGDANSVASRDSQLIYARPGEFVMRNSAVDMIGVDVLEELNALGNRRNETGGTQSAQQALGSNSAFRSAVGDPTMKRMANGGSVGEGALASRAVERALAVPTDSKMTFNFSVPQLPGLDKTLSAGAVPPISAADKDKDKAGNQMVNVWVVSKDNIPPPGPRDIIAMVASDIQNKGSIRSLIQQVNLGTI